MESKTVYLVNLPPLNSADVHELRQLLFCFPEVVGTFEPGSSVGTKGFLELPIAGLQ